MHSKEWALFKPIIYGFLLLLGKKNQWPIVPIGDGGVTQIYVPHAAILTLQKLTALKGYFDLYNALAMQTFLN